MKLCKAEENKKVDFLNREMERGYCYPTLAEFCLWLLDSGLWKTLSLEQIEKLVKYIGECEHVDGDEYIPEENWEHYVHAELGKECLVCRVKDIARDYILYQSFR